MNKLIGSPTAKTAAILTAIITAIIIVFLSFVTIYFIQTDVYTQPLTAARQEQMKQKMTQLSHEAVSGLTTDVSPDAILKDVNFYCDIYKNGVLVYDGYSNQEAQLSYEVTIPYKEWSYDPQTGEEVVIASAVYTVQGYIPKQLTKQDTLAVQLTLLEQGYRYRYAAPIVAVGLIILEIILLVFLYAAAGHRRNTDEIVLNYFDRIPLDVFTLMLGLPACLLVAAAMSDWWLFCVGSVGIYLLGLWYTMSVAARIKSGCLFKNCLCYKGAVWLLRKCGLGIRYVKKGLKQLPLLWKTVCILGGSFLCQLIILWMFWVDLAPLAILLWLFANGVLWCGTLYVGYMLKCLQKGGQNIAMGQLDYHVNTAYMIGDFKDFGEALNDINAGVSRAVEQRMKSERFKTELITNVSHDIKTPLTSIINYVDLIQKEPTDNEAIREYAAVLERQSFRLKKLIEDLVEASKASTGDLTVTMAPCEVGVLLAQTLGEYQERLQEKGLETILNQSIEPIFIMADSRHLWRVFDNLMNNILKYALPSTRVYLTLERQANQAVITFRNISKDPLPVDSEEKLLERFVRGDSSRNTPGSGLGLSIAQSLTQLQKGNMKLTVDGDLFKVQLLFDILE